MEALVRPGVADDTCTGSLSAGPEPVKRAGRSAAPHPIRRQARSVAGDGPDPSPWAPTRSVSRAVPRECSRLSALPRPCVAVRVLRGVALEASRAVLSTQPDAAWWQGRGYTGDETPREYRVTRARDLLGCRRGALLRPPAPALEAGTRWLEKFDSVLACTFLRPPLIHLAVRLGPRAASTVPGPRVPTLGSGGRA